MDLSNTPPIPLIYIMGSGRSGSTLLSSLLGTQLDVLSAGEIYNYKNFFETATELKRNCSCGVPLMECYFWHEVRREMSLTAGHELADLKDQENTRFEMNNYALFSALVKVSGKSVIVDSSKRHYRLKLLLESPLFDVVIVHLVRDARAYAYSSLLTARQRGKADSAYYLKLFDWQKKNLGIKAIYGRMRGYTLVRYEDLVTNPATEIARILDVRGIKFDMDRISKPSATQQHEFSGNKRSIRRKLNDIKLDTRYLKNLTQSQWRLGTGLTLPALAMFGYPLRRNSALTWKHESQ